MKRYYPIVIAILLTSCGKSKPPVTYEGVADTVITAPKSDVVLSEVYVYKDSRLKDYEIFLNQLNTSDEDNIQVATTKFKELFSKAEQQTCDSAYYLFENFYSLVDEAINDLHYKDTTNYDSLVLSFDTASQINLSKKLTDFRDKLVRNGFQLSMTEGSTFIQADRAYIKEHFYANVSPLMVSYLEQLDKENDEGFGEDGGLVIDSKTLVDRIVWWENFNAANPDFIFKRTPYYSQRAYTNALITGEDNTPLFWDVGGPLDEYFKTGYEYLFSKYPDSKTAGLLKPYYAALTKPDTAAIRKFQKQHVNYN